MASIYSIEDSGFKEIKSISDDSYKALNRDCHIVIDCHSQFVIFKYLELQIKDYSQFLKGISNIATLRFNHQVVDSHRFLIEINRNVLNILTSFKFFLDNAESYLKREFGKDSEQVSGFKKLTNELFDSKFSYRFLYKLRNYSVHLGFPIHSIKFKTRKRESNPEDMVGDVIPEVILEDMLSEKDLFGPVYQDLLKLTSNIDIRPLIYDLSKSILNIQKYIHKLRNDELMEAISNIELFTKKYKTENNQIAIIDKINIDDEFINFSKSSIPYDMIDEFKELNNNWC